MSRNQISLGIDPSGLYDHADAARLLKKQPDWFKEHLIHTGELPYFQAGNSYWILGYALIDYAARNQTTWQGRKSKSKRFAAEDTDDIS